MKAESSAQFCPKYPEERDTFFEIDVKKPGIIKENIPHKMQTAGLALQITMCFLLNHFAVAPQKVWAMDHSLIENAAHTLSQSNWHRQVICKANPAVCIFAGCSL